MESVKRGFSLVALLGITACVGERGAGDRVQGAEWTAEPTVRAGEVDGTGALADVFNVAVGPGDTILVAQPTVPTISVFDAEGAFVRTVGRAGPGPGEFQVLRRIGFTGDTLWVVGHGRLYLFDPALRYVRAISPSMPDPPAGVTRMIPGPLMADGSILGIPFSLGGAEREPVMLLTQTGSMQRILARVSSEGRVVDVDLGTGPPVSVANPWPDFPLWLNAVDGRSLVIVERRAATERAGAAFGIVRIGLDGDTLVDEAIAYAPIPLGRPERDRAYRALAERTSRMRSITVAAAEDEIRSRLPAPHFHPPVTGLVVGMDGTIWLRREAMGRDSVAWQVFSESGEELGRVRLPAVVEVHAVEAGRVWGVVRDSLDVPFVQVYEIGPSA